MRQRAMDLTTMITQVTAFTSLLFFNMNLSASLDQFKGVSNVTVFNAYINQDVFAKVSFGKEKMERISYGSYKTSSLSRSEDYIIQFVKLPNGGKNSKITCSSTKYMLSHDYDKVTLTQGKSI